MINRLLIDGHVHVHECFNEETFLANAHANLSVNGGGFPTLLLAEIAGSNAFARWSSGKCSWDVSTTDESSSLVLGERLLIIAGRQVVTEERIEVLAQITDRQFDDGRPLDETIETILETGALVVLPWGVGKWTGERGRKVRLAAARFPVLLGDNAGRPRGWPNPRLFRNQQVLPGTDPLRLPAEQCIVGTFGFALSGEFDIHRPGSKIGSALRKPGAVKPFGNRVHLIRCLKQQIGLRIAK